MQNLEDKEIKTSKSQYMAIGIAIGMMIGVAMDNIPIGICIGVALGTAYSANAKKEENKKDKE